MKVEGKTQLPPLPPVQQAASTVKAAQHQTKAPETAAPVAKAPAHLGKHLDVQG